MKPEVGQFYMWNRCKIWKIQKVLGKNYYDLEHIEDLIETGLKKGRIVDYKRTLKHEKWKYLGTNESVVNILYGK